VTNVGGNSVTLLRNTTGGLVTEGTTQVGGAPQDLVAADFNGDSRPDLAVSNNAGTVSVLLRTANGFTDEPGSPIATGGAHLGITSADYNRDCRPALAVAADSAGVIVLARNAAGGFTPDTTLSPGGPAGGVAAADFDADGT